MEKKPVLHGEWALFVVSPAYGGGNNTENMTRI